jgi:hypothetical protein
VNSAAIVYSSGNAPYSLISNGSLWQWQIPGGGGGGVGGLDNILTWEQQKFLIL